MYKVFLKSPTEEIRFYKCNFTTATTNMFHSLTLKMVIDHLHGHNRKNTDVFILCWDLAQLIRLNG